MGEHSDWQVDVGTRLPSQLPVAWRSAGAWGMERWMALPVFVSYTRGIKLGNRLGRRRGCSCEAALAFSAPLRSHGALNPSQVKTTRVRYEKRSIDRNVNVHLREITKWARPTDPPVHQPVVMLESVVALVGAPRRVLFCFPRGKGGLGHFSPRWHESAWGLGLVSSALRVGTRVPEKFRVEGGPQPELGGSSKCSRQGSVRQSCAGLHIVRLCAVNQGVLWPEPGPGNWFCR